MSSRGLLLALCGVLVSGVALAFGPPGDSEELAAERAAAFAAADADGNGALTLVEFEKLREIMQQKRLEFRFARLDSDGSGQVSFDELGDGMKHRHRRGGPRW